MSAVFTAYALQPPLLELRPAPIRRPWMDASPGSYANRCLPLLIANQSGWELLNRGTIRARWGAGDGPGDVLVEAEGTEDPPTSHFGRGILTWRIPYLFRTPPGWNLLVRGPANLPKDGASSLEGVVETDWAVAPAFHSWQLTRRDHTVVWEDGEPICTVLPQRRGELEDWRPETRDVFGDPVLADEYVTFSESRADFNATRPRAWQKDYFRGRSPGSAVAVEHQTRLHLQSFQAVLPSEGADRPTSGAGTST